MTVKLHKDAFSFVMAPLALDTIDMERGSDGVWRVASTNSYFTYHETERYMEDRETGIRFAFIDEIAPIDFDVVAELLRKHIEFIK